MQYNFSKKLFNLFSKNYFLKMAIHFLLLAIIILASILYSANLLVIWTHRCLLDEKMTTMCYLIPIFILSYSLLIIITKYLPCENIYCSIYLVFVLYLGYLLYIFFTALILRIVDACFDIPSYIGLPILYGVP